MNTCVFINSDNFIRAEADNFDKNDRKERSLDAIFMFFKMVILPTQNNKIPLSKVREEKTS